MTNHLNTPNKSLHQRGKDSKLSVRMQNVCNELKKGRRSAADLSIILGYSDPRSYIKRLRDKGITVRDEWVQSSTRYKRYWIEPEEERTGLMHISEVIDCILTKKGVKDE